MKTKVLAGIMVFVVALFIMVSVALAGRKTAPSTMPLWKPTATQPMGNCFICTEEGCYWAPCP